MAPVRRLRHWKIGKDSLSAATEEKGVDGSTSRGGPSGYKSTQLCCQSRNRPVRSAILFQRLVCLTVFSCALSTLDCRAAWNASDSPSRAGISTARSRRWCKMSFLVVPADQGMVFHSSWAKKDGWRVVREAPTWLVSFVFLDHFCEESIYIYIYRDIPNMDGVR